MLRPRRKAACSGLIRLGRQRPTLLLDLTLLLPLRLTD